MTKFLLAALFSAGLFCFISLNLLTAPPESLPVTSPAKDKTNINYRQLKGVIHLQTPVSGGTRSINDYIQLARRSQIDALVITDHDTQKYEYSLWPLRWLINYTVEEKSAFKFGVTRYLRQIETAAGQNRDIVIVDGMESAPFYYWSGSPFQNNLTLNSRGQHLLVLGLKKTDDYRNLPVISNGRSNYDQYHGDQGVQPYQDLIDYATARGGLVFWAHPEAKESKKINGVNIHTLPYPTVLRQIFNYTGFAVLEEGYQKVGQPGGIWDEVLKEYCLGKRQSPVWAIGELDDYGKKVLDSVLTMFLVKEKNSAAILEALKTGRMYVATNYYNKALMRLDDFSIKDPVNPDFIGTAISGEEIECAGKPPLHIKISHYDINNQPAKYSITVKIIRNGRLIKEFNESTPFEVNFQEPAPPERRQRPDNYFEPGQKNYYRLDVTDELNNKLISNPIFVSSR